jgi:hypothetical protein
MIPLNCAAWARPLLYQEIEYLAERRGLGGPTNRDPDATRGSEIAKIPTAKRFSSITFWCPRNSCSLSHLETLTQEKWLELK